MPIAWNLPTTTGSWPVQDIERFNRLPFWMAQQQTAQIPYWSRWKDLFGKIKWKSNLGDTLVGVVSEYSAINSQVHKPNYITSTPLKTVASNFERTNVGRIYRHKFESPLFNWLPSFRDFQQNQLSFAAKDLNKIIAVGYDNFIRNQLFQLSPAVYVAGQSSPYTTGVPVGPPGEGVLTDPKDANFLATMASNVGPDGYLDFKTIVAIRSIARNVAGITPWDGAPDAPGDNEILKGRWILMGEGSIYEALSFDEHILNTRPLAMDLQHKEWSGIISGNILFREERYPMRIAADGSFPAPEIEQELPVNSTITSGSSTVTNPGGASRRIQVIPNPAYVNAPIGVAWFLGHQPGESIDVGPPPSEFASGKMSASRVSKLNWNGEVRLTDDVLVQYGGSSGLDINTLDTNKYGEFLQLISDTVLGYIPKTSRNAIPIFYRRNNTPSLTATT